VECADLKETPMLTLWIHLAAAIRGYLAFYMPTNRLVDWLRTPRGLKWAVPVALVTVPVYLFAMSVSATVVERGGQGYLNVLVFLFAWNALKFASVALLTPIRGLQLAIAHRTGRVTYASPRD
jgi:hypothetical protein